MVRTRKKTSSKDKVKGKGGQLGRKGEGEGKGGKTKAVKNLSFETETLVEVFADDEGESKDNRDQEGSQTSPLSTNDKRNKATPSTSLNTEEVSDSDSEEESDYEEEND